MEPNGNTSATKVLRQIKVMIRSPFLVLMRPNYCNEPCKWRSTLKRSVKDVFVGT